VIELVRAESLMKPEGYRWSGYGTKVGAVKQEWLDFDPQYLGLASTERNGRRIQSLCSGAVREDWSRCGERYSEAS
jgi:hypothetical protein